MGFTPSPGGQVMRRFFPTLATVALAGVSALTGGARAADKDDDKKTEKVVGMVVFKDGFDFGPDAVAVVQLLDVSLADAPAVTVEKVTLKNLKSFPIAFEIPYDPKAINPKAEYALSVRIMTGERLDFINDTRCPVITRDAPTKDVKVAVVRVKR
jgi:putative lipoprotein